MSTQKQMKSRGKNDAQPTNEHKSDCGRVFSLCQQTENGGVQ